MSKTLKRKDSSEDNDSFLLKNTRLDSEDARFRGTLETENLLRSPQKQNYNNNTTNVESSKTKIVLLGTVSLVVIIVVFFLGVMVGKE